MLLYNQTEILLTIVSPLVNKFHSYQVQVGQRYLMGLQCGHYEALGVNIRLPEYARECSPSEVTYSAIRGCRSKPIPIPPPDPLWFFYSVYL
jgi:hypothetical protein